MRRRCESVPNNWRHSIGTDKRGRPRHPPRIAAETTRFYWHTTMFAGSRTSPTEISFTTATNLDSSEPQDATAVMVHSFERRTNSIADDARRLNTTRRSRVIQNHSKIERTRRDLNPRHLGPEPSTLSTELRALTRPTVLATKTLLELRPPRRTLPRPLLHRR